MQSINYQALGTQKTQAQKLQDLQAKGTLYNYVRSLSILVAAIIGFFVVVAAVVVAFLFQPLVATFVFVVVFGTYFWRMLRKDIRSRQAFEKFIADNGWKIGGNSPINPVLTNKGYTIMPAKATGALGKSKFWVHTVASPTIKNKRLVTFEALVIELPAKLPTILVMSGLCPVSVLAERLAKRAFGLAPLRLEGDFDKAARAYCQSGKEAQALTYLTPDVMAVLADKVVNVVLYADRYLYVSTNTAITEPGVAKSLFHDAELIVTEILEKQI